MLIVIVESVVETIVVIKAELTAKMRTGVGSGESVRPIPGIVGISRRAVVSLSRTTAS